MGATREPITAGGRRCTLVIADDLPRWLAANAAAALGVAMGAHGLIPVGPDLRDEAGSLHPGIGTTPLPVLTARAEELPALRDKALELGLSVIDFNDAAHASATYDEYEKHMLAKPVAYLGLALCGPKKQILSVTGNLRSLQ